MAYEQRDMSGTLFKNHKKESDRHPDYRGDALINGVPVWMSAWIKEGPKGKYMSIAFQPKDEQRRSSQDVAFEAQKPVNNKPFDDIDIPF